MSKYKSSGKGRGNPRAGLQFDRLLKACSNSKKPPAAMAAGAMGRFGVPQFTSTRSIMEATGEEELQEKPARFASLHKRPRLSMEPLQPPNLQLDAPYYSNNTHGYNTSSDEPPSLQPQVQTVLKPRKFFKSRGPMEVDVRAGSGSSFVPSPQLYQTPILSNVNYNSTVTPTPPPKKNRDKTPSPKKRGKTSPLSTTFTSPPSIKIKIIKDKVTSKFVSVSEGAGDDDDPPLAVPTTPKRGRKRQYSMEEQQEPKKMPANPKGVKGRGVGGRRRQQRSPTPEETTPEKKPPPPPNPKRAAGRVTRASARYQDNPEPVGDSQNEEPIQCNNETLEHSGSEETLKKLEEDAEYQKLSKMLSSMEEGEGEPTPPPRQRAESDTSEEVDLHRSILEDDWNESYEDDSPKKVLQSPPKVSRFDPSAFGHKEEEEDSQRRISFDHSSPEAHQPHSEPSNLNSSPYAMKNLLGVSARSISDSQEQSQFQQEIDSQGTTVSYTLSEARSRSQSQESTSDGQQLQGGSQTTDGGYEGSPVKGDNNAQPKKASIFKSRASIKSDTKKAIYKHTFGQEDKKAETEETKTALHPPGKIFEDFDDDPDLSLHAGSQGGDGDGKVFCAKGAKKLFTVVRNVKAGHELQESGEFHEFDGDVMYILEDLKAKHPMNSRCLSAITLAGRCMDQAFRMHLRAHGTVTEFCKELSDAPQHPVLSLLAATVLFVLSQDRLNMDLDTESLKLILALTKADSSSQQNENAETVKNRQRVMQLCEEMKNRGHAEHLNLDKITASELALETLLYLTSKRAGEWVKHELRTLGGLDSIVGEVESSFNFVRKEIIACRWDEQVTERFRKIDRCLGVLGQVTFNHEDNQKYLMQVSTREVENGPPVKCTPASPILFIEMFRFCKEVLNREEQSLSVEQVSIVREILFLVLRLLVNLSHDYRGIVVGSEILMKMEGFLELVLHSVFQMTSKFPDEKVFDLLMHSFCLLLNLVEVSRNNRLKILQTTIRKTPSGNYNIDNDSEDSGVEDEIPVLDALTQMFLQRENSARKEEQHTDNILTTTEDNNTKKKEQKTDQQDQEGSSVQDTIDKLIQTAGKHMENSLIAAYISLFIAFLVMDDMENEEKERYVERVRKAMPDGTLLPLTVVLKKLFNFMSITSSASGSNRGLKASATALKFYGKVDPASAQELKKIIPE